jgi:hypothetical protein
MDLQRLLDTLGLISGLVVLGGEIGWLVAVSRRFLTRGRPSFTDAVTHGAGFGGLAGIFAAVPLLLS